MNLNFGKNIDRVIRELPEYAAELMKENEKEVSALVKEQITSGFRGDGQRTKRYVSKPYIIKMQKQTTKSFPYRNYFVNGDFLNETFVETTVDNNVFIGSAHRLNTYIEPQEENLFGITDKNNPIVSKIIVKPLLNKVGNELVK